MDDILANRMQNKIPVFNIESKQLVYVTNYGHDYELYTFWIECQPVEGGVTYCCYPEDLDFEVDCNQFTITP